MKLLLSFRPGLMLGLVTALAAALAPITARAQSFTMYVSNTSDGTIAKVTPAGVVSTFASGFSDTIHPLALDGSGNLYVADFDFGANTVSKVTPAGAVTTFASGFNNPDSLTFDPTSGNLYVSNDGNGTISKITSAGVVSTFASGFNYPSGLACDGSGNLYVADYNLKTISKITPAGVISTFASGLNTPYALAFDGSGNLFVSSLGNGTISKITPAGVVSTFVSGFSYPAGLAFDASGNLYVADYTLNTVSKITPAGVISTFASGFNKPIGLAIFLPPPAPTITSQPQNQGFFTGRAVPAAFTVQASGVAGADTFQWQISTDNGATWTTLSDNATYSGTTSPTLSIPSVTSAMAGYEYECVVTNVSGSATSNPATLTKLPFLMFVSNYNDNTVSEITPSGKVSLFASGFNGPEGLAFDSSGNLYVANYSGNTVSKVTPAGVVSTFATGFNGPEGLALDGSDNLYVANEHGNTVSKVTPAGVVSTFATGFNGPEGLAFDGSGNLYVANYSGTVSKITPIGVVSTFASGFENPVGLTFDGSGNLYVASFAGGMVSKVTPAGVVGTFATGFNLLQALAFDSSGNLYLTNGPYYAVSELTTAGNVSTFASGLAYPKGLAIIAAPAAPAIISQPQNQGFISGHASLATFGVSVSGAPGLNNFQWQVSADGGTTWTSLVDNSTYGGTTAPTLVVIGSTSAMSGYRYECVVTNAIGSVTSTPATLKSCPFLMDVASTGTGTVSVVTPAGVVSTLAAGFNEPEALAFDGGGNLYVANEGDNTVVKITPTGAVSTFATGFNGPAGLAFDGDGNLYVANGNIVSKITPAGVVSTFATGFDEPAGLAFDGSGNLYVANLGSDTISKITPAGVVSIFASIFGAPLGLAFDANGNLYVANCTGGAILKITPAGDISTFATGFYQPQGLVFDANSNLYVTDAYWSTISMVTPVGIVSTFASGFSEPGGIAIISAPAAPVFSLVPGAYSGAQSVTITSATNGASIRYTTDSSAPSETNGTLYAGPITLGIGTTTLNAIAYETGFADSAVTGGSYVITDPFLSFVGGYGLDPATTGAASANPSGDGISNLLKFVLGGDPTVADRSILPTSNYTTVSGQPVLVYVYNQTVASLPVVTATVQYSSDLSTWTTAVDGVNGVTIRTTALDGATNQVTVTIPAGDSLLFAKLHIVH